MVFKRRNRRTIAGWAREMVYPTGGFKRAAHYVLHRMRRLPDNPRRIARGVFAGSMVGFLPLPGLQFLAAWLASRVVNGNLLAALLATFNTNPLTTPFFAMLAMSLGHWMLGIEKPLSADYIGQAFGHAGADLWFNLAAAFGPQQARWEGLVQFWHEIYLPYVIGALGPGLILSLIFYYLTIPLVHAYQKARAATARERSEKRSKLRAALAEAAARLTHPKGDKVDAGDDDAPGSP